MRFYTPDEQRLLATLPTCEATLVRELFDVLDARLVTDTPVGAARPDVADVPAAPPDPVPAKAAQPSPLLSLLSEEDL